MGTTKIEWADRVWNPVTGCTKVSDGCRYCYAETIARRFWGDRKFTDVRVHEDRLNDPFHWKKPSRVFVNSMSDLFHPDVPVEFILRVWITMALANRHTFIILSKRPDRMQNLLTHWLPGAFGISTFNLSLMEKPLNNVWLGVSVENQKAADKRIPLLLQTPAAVRFVSIEPMLGPVDLLIRPGDIEPFDPFAKSIDWVICGGESGTGARPMHPDWVRSVRDQCQVAGVPFFFKQWGEWLPVSQSLHLLAGEIANVPYHTWGDETESILNLVHSVRVGKHKAGRLLDGREWNEFPEVE